MVKNKYPAVTVYPTEMQMEELIVTTTADTADLTPTSGKRIRVLGFCASQRVHTNLTTVPATATATLSFGTSGDVMISFSLAVAGDFVQDSMDNINVVGAVDELVTLTNITFSAGTMTTQATIYYIEE